jgi:hypothetical protein
MSNADMGSTPETGGLWRELAGKIGGEYREGPWYNEHIIMAHHREWIIKLDTYVAVTSVGEEEDHTVFTRIRTPYVTKDRFRFRVYQEGFWSKIGKLLGMQDIEIGDESFDNTFIIKSNMEGMVKEFFGNQRIREIMMSRPSIHLEVGDAEGRFEKEHTGAVYEVYHREHEVPVDQEYLMTLYDLVVLCLDRLCELDSAWDEGPVPITQALREKQIAADW